MATKKASAGRPLAATTKLSRSKLVEADREVVSELARRVELLRRRAEDHPGGRARVLRMVVLTDALAGKGPRPEDAASVRKWLLNNHRRQVDESLAPSHVAVLLPVRIARDERRSAWSRRPALARRSYIDKVRLLSAELATLLEESDAPRIPAVIDLFDHINVPPPVYRQGLQQASTPKEMRCIYDQRLSSVLRRLHGHTSLWEEERQVDPRAMDVSELARALGRFFVERYRLKSAPHTLIACLLNLAEPDMTFDAEQVGRWIRAKS